MLLIVIGLTVEIGGQIYAYLHPAYKVLPFAPDPFLGWRFIPNSEHIITGNHWYAREYSTTNKINSHGFRDFERKFKKNENTIRIGLLGDSMIAAREVAFEKTAGQLLEKKLNKKLSHKTSKKYEVLNFGVPGYGVDQMVLNWKNYISKFNLDFVFLYLFENNYLRTISATWCSKGFFGIEDLGDRNCLFIRPVAIVKKHSPGKLTLEDHKKFVIDYLYINLKDLEAIKPLLNSKNYKQTFQLLNELQLSILNPSEYEKFVKEQNKYIEKKMNGERMIKKEKQWFLLPIFSEFITLLNNIQKVKKSQLKIFNERQKKYAGYTQDFPSWTTTNLVNLKLVQYLNNWVNKSGGQLGLVDTFSFHAEPTPPLSYASNLLNQLALSGNISYIPLYKKLIKSREEGLPTIWKHDPHLNERGNKIFTDSMFDVLEKKFIQ